MDSLKNSLMFFKNERKITEKIVENIKKLLKVILQSCSLIEKKEKENKQQIRQDKIKNCNEQCENYNFYSFIQRQGNY